MNIGLARGTVFLVDYDPEWHKLFHEEAELLRKTLSIEINNIQHVGSTAIPPIKAKPIIDIAILVNSLESVNEWVNPLNKIGYWNKGKEPNMPDRRFFAKGPVSKRTVYVHFVNKQEFDRMSKFRDKLIKDQDLAKEYSNLKEKLAIENSKKRDSYTSAKHDFIQKVINS